MHHHLAAPSARAISPEGAEIEGRERRLGAGALRDTSLRFLASVFHSFLTDLCVYGVASGALSEQSEVVQLHADNADDSLSSVSEEEEEIGIGG
eukprot:COSAG02_NODE_37985_length_435_cov_0.616071_1_plen_94_part_00